MADVRIKDLTTASSPARADFLALDRTAGTGKIAASSLLGLIQPADLDMATPGLLERTSGGAFAVRMIGASDDTDVLTRIDADGRYALESSLGAYYTQGETDSLLAANASGDRARTNHTGTQLAATISDFSTAADARIAASSIQALTDVTITSPQDGEVLTYNGTAWVNEAAPAGGGGTPGGSNTEIQFNDSGAFGGDAGLTYNKTSDTLTAGHLVASDGSATAASIGFASAPNDGLYLVVPGAVGVTTAGAFRALFGVGGVTLQNGAGNWFFAGYAQPSMDGTQDIGDPTHRVRDVHVGRWRIWAQASANPTAADVPASSIAEYVKAGKKVRVWNDAGTLRYQVLTLGTDTTWGAWGTTAP